MQTRDVAAQRASLTDAQRELLARRLRGQAAGAPRPDAIPRRARGPVPLAPTQERFWFLEQLQPGTAFYVFCGAVRLDGRVDAAVLERCLREVVRRHDALRMVFRQQGDSAVQEPAPEVRFRLPVADLRHLPEAEREAAAARLADEEASRPFDLFAGPPFRATLATLDDDRHVLVLAAHHIVMDRWSMGVVFQEIAKLYGPFSRGEASPLPEPAIQYGDFVLWQRDLLAGPATERQLAWWSERLRGHQVAEVPTDRPRPAAQSFRGAMHRVTVPAELTRRLNELARREDATLFMVLYAAWNVVLSRWTGLDDLLLGTPVESRTRAETEQAVGLFVNTLALRTDLSGDPPFRELLARVRDLSVASYARHDLPLARLIEALKLPRDPSRQPLTPIIFAFALQFTLEFDGIRLSPFLHYVDNGTSKYDLSLLTMVLDGETVIGQLEYCTDLYDAATVRRIGAQWLALLRAAAEAPERRISALASLPPGEEERVAALAAGPAAHPDTAAGVHTLFARQAARTPGAVALAGDGGEMTYAELDRASRRLAARLSRRGAGPGARIGVCLERGPGLVVAVLAALRTGGAYVPLDPSYPPARLAWMAADAGVRLLVTTASLRDSVAAADAEAVLLDGAGDADRAGDADGGGPGVDAGPEALAYVIYTSGSTGTPKGVAVPHRAVVRLARGGGFADTGAGESWLQLAPASFDAATLELWAPLLNGGRLVFHPAVPASAASLRDTIRRHGVTSLWLTAGLFHAVVDEDVQALRGVRQLLAGGDVLSPAHVRRALAAHPELRLIDGYGPTENTTFTACHPVRAADAEGASIPVGRPVAGTQAWVLDRGMRPCPVAVPGELYAGGDGLAWGYLGRPALTAERFVPDPLSGRPGARLYRTGDRARWRPDGALEFLGRMDQQVKVRGFRVEPGEVEAALAEHPAVRQAVVVARPDGAGEKRLVAYVSPRGPGAPAAAELRDAVAGRLPAHLVPSAFVVLDALPLTPNGKVDRAALPTPGADAEAYVAPRTPMEEALAAIWAEVLGLPRVGVEDDFFLLGGHSLVATRVITRVRDRLGLEFPLQSVFEAPTVAAFAAVAARAEAEVLARLAALESLSDDEVAALLAAAGQGGAA